MSSFPEPTYQRFFQIIDKLFGSHYYYAHALEREEEQIDAAHSTR